MKRIFSVISALLICVASVLFMTSCNGGKKEFEKRVETPAGNVFVTLSTKKEDGGSFSDKELREQCQIIGDAVSETYLYYSENTYIKELNSQVDAVLDCDKKTIKALNTLSKISEKTEGAYTPFGGAYTELFKGEEAPAPEAVAAAITHIGADKFTVGENFIKKSDREAKIDLCSASAGFAIDAGSKAMKESGTACGSIRFGSFVYAFGYEKDKLSVGVAGETGTQGYIKISDGFVAAVSEGYTYSETVEGTIDRVYVVSDSGVNAAVVADAVYALGFDGTKELYKNSKIEFEAVMVKGEKCTLTKGMTEEVYTAETKEK